MNRAVEQELMNCPIGMVHEDYRRLLGSRGSLVGAGPRTHDRVALRTSALHDRTWRHAVPTMSSAKKVTSSFIEQLLCMLDDAEIQDFEDIIGWLPEGIAFKVLIIKDFEELILPHYLNQTKMRSFQRQLVKHGFFRVQGGEARGTYTHPKFIKDNRASCLEIRRKAPAGRSSSRGDAVARPELEISPMSDHFKQAIYASRPWFLRTRHSDRADDKERDSATSTEDEEVSSDGCSPPDVEGGLVRAVSLERNSVLVGAPGRTMKLVPSHVVEQQRISQTSSLFAAPSSLQKAAVVAFLKASPVNPTEKPNAATDGNTIFRVNSLEERVDEEGASNLVAAGMIELLPSFRYEDPGFPFDDISLIDESVDEMIWEDGVQYPALEPENPW